MPTVTLLLIICSSGPQARCIEFDHGTYRAPRLCAAAGWPLLGKRREADTEVMAFTCSLIRSLPKPGNR